MEQKLDLKKLEKNSTAALFQTGIVEIGIGMIFLVSTLAMIFDDIRYYIDILFIVPPVFIYLATRYIANPRLGVVKLAKKRVRKRMYMIITITTFLVIMVAFTFFGYSNSTEPLINPRWEITGIIFMICIAVAYFLEFDRMFFYAFLLAGAFNLSEEIREHSWVVSNGGYAYLVASSILIIIGSIYLFRFLKKYKIPEERVTYGE